MQCLVPRYLFCDNIYYLSPGDVEPYDSNPAKKFQRYKGIFKYDACINFHRGRVKKGMKKKLIFLIITLCLFLSKTFISAEDLPSHFKSGSEPDGFGGITWGTDITTLSDMEYIWTDLNVEEIKIYTRPGDDLRIGDAKLEWLGYGFWKGKFYDVRIHFKGSKNFANIRDTVFENFGSGYKPNTMMDRYTWPGSKTYMTLEYNGISGEGFLILYSTELNKKAKKYE